MDQPDCEAKRLIVAFDLAQQEAKVINNGNLIRIALIEGHSSNESDIVIQANDLNAKIEAACEHPDVYCTPILRSCGFVYNAKVCRFH
jgi:hypothetical protein